MSLDPRKMLLDSLVPRINAINFPASPFSRRVPMLPLSQAMQRAFAAYERGEWAAAEQLCRMVLNAKADHFDALHLCGVVAGRTGRTQEATELLLRAVQANPNNANAYYHRGVALSDLQRHAEALESYDRALALKPDFAKAHNNRGIALGDLQRHAEAVASYDQALALKPDYAEAHNNRAAALVALNLHVEALESYDRALAIKPDYAEAHNNRGMTLSILHRDEEAMESYARALQLKPDYDFLYGRWLYAKMRVCDWNDVADHLVRLDEKVERNERASPAFVVVALRDSPSIQRKAAELWVQDRHPTGPSPPATGRAGRQDKICIGYFSADFRNHPVSILAAELFEEHDRSKFEVIAFSYGPDSNDEMRNRLVRAFDRFLDVRASSDEAIARLARELQVDIAIDLGGFTRGGRTGIFAMRAAPVQVNYLGYPGTMGAEYIDYLVADAHVIPPGGDGGYAEKIVRVPDTFQVNDSRRRIAERMPARAEVGLPAAGFVFCCFNNSYKITPVMFDVWMRLLRENEGSVLWLQEANAAATRNLRSEAGTRSIAPERLVFAGRTTALEDHLARYRLADLFLDTSPYNAHATASDALWAGLPVITCSGRTFAGRVAGSLLNALGLPELVTDSLEDYEALALRLAKTPTLLSVIRAKLQGNRSSFPLFDTDRFRRHIESAYITMWRRYQQGEPPASFSVPPIR